MSIPELIDTYTDRLHEDALGCHRAGCKTHSISVAAIRADLVLFMGELLTAFELEKYGDPLPQEEREFAESERQDKLGPFGSVTS